MEKKERQFLDTCIIFLTFLFDLIDKISRNNRKSCFTFGSSCYCCYFAEFDFFRVSMKIITVFLNLVGSLTNLHGYTIFWIMSCLLIYHTIYERRINLLSPFKMITFFRIDSFPWIAKRDFLVIILRLQFICQFFPAIYREICQKYTWRELDVELKSHLFFNGKEIISRTFVAYDTVWSTKRS